MPGVRQLAEALCDALTAFEPGTYSGADCAALTELLARTANSCQAAGARAATRVAECGTYRDRGFTDPVAWLARAAGSSARAARAAFSTVAAVKDCPATRGALVAGKLSLAQAAEIASVPEDEAELLAIAMRSSLGALREEARARWLAAIPPETLHERRREAREFVRWKNRLGMTCFRGALPPEVGVPFAKRMDVATDRLWRAARREGREATRVQCAADAFAQLVNGEGQNTARGADMVIVTDLRAYRRGHAHPGEVSHIVGGGPIPVSLALELAKDAFLKAVLHDGVEIHTVKHFGRRRPAELETALMLGTPPDFDGVSCAAVGCDRKLGLQWDHQDPVANRGPTSAENLQPLCEPHHREKTERDRRAGRLRGRPP